MSVESKHYFNLWKADMEELGGSRFSSGSRKEIIEDLVNLFLVNGVSIDEASNYKKQVSEILTTKHGRKKESFKQWVDKVESDYDIAVSSIYLAGNISDGTNNISKQMVDESTLLENNLPISNWLEEKYGEYTKDMYLQAHTIGSLLNIMFIEDYFFKNNG